MPTQSTHAIAALFLVIWIANDAAGQVRPGRGPLISYAHGGNLWAATDAGPADFSCTILQGMLTGNTPPSAFYFYGKKDFDYPFCWRIGHGYYWQGTGHMCRDNNIYRVGLADLDLFESRDQKTRETKIAARYPDDKRLGKMSLWAEPAVRLGGELWDKSPTLLVTDAYYDFFPTAANRLSLFILHQKSIRIMTGEFAEAPKGKRDWDWWDYKWAKEPAEKIKANFHAPFIVYPIADTYYFLTQFCECHGLKRDWFGRRETVALWNKEDQPISRLVTDTATGKTFAFTLPLERKDGTKAKPGYFELSAKPELIEYDPAKIKKNDFEYPYKQIRECVDILLADKKIDPEKHKSKDKK